LLGRVFPDALIANDHDAYAFGLNAVSDGLHVFIPCGARQLREELITGGYRPVSVDLSELIKGGGSVKCCTQEIRPASIPSRNAAARALSRSKGTSQHASTGSARISQRQEGAAS
jgi:hypothetical protein